VCVCVCVLHMSSLSPCLRLPVYFIFVESDPSLNEFACIEVRPPDDVLTDVTAVALPMFAKCGVCRERSPTALCISESWPLSFAHAVAFSKDAALYTRMETFVQMLGIAGSVCCDDSECSAISQLRADTRARSIKTLKALCRQMTVSDELKACAFCSAPRELRPTFMCGRCRAVRYCDASCQHRHWKFHKPFCTGKIE